MIRTTLSAAMIFIAGITHINAQPIPLHGANPKAENIPLPKRVEQLEKRLSNKTFLNMFKQMQGLRKEVKQLRGEVESLSDELRRVKKRQREFYLDLDQRISGVQGADTSIPATDYSPLTAPPIVEQKDLVPIAPPVQSKPPTVTEKKAYDNAFRTLQSGEYNSAIDQLSRFVEKYPNSELSDNAQYWLGEAHYVQRDFDAAKTAFDQVIQRYPNSSKVADALLKTGFIAFEEGNVSKAEGILKSVIERYPESTVARLAKERLARISKSKP